MSHEEELIPAGHTRTTPNPPAVRAPGNAAPQRPAADLRKRMVSNWYSGSLC